MFVLIAVGPTLSGLQLTEGFVDVEKFFWAAFGLWVRPNCGDVAGPWNILITEAIHS